MNVEFDCSSKISVTSKWFSPLLEPSYINRFEYIIDVMVPTKFSHGNSIKTGLNRGLPQTLPK